MKTNKLVQRSKEQFLAIVAKKYATRTPETATMEIINKKNEFIFNERYKLLTKTSIWETKRVSQENKNEKFI